MTNESDKESNFLFEYLYRRKRKAKNEQRSNSNQSHAPSLAGGGNFLGRPGHGPCVARPQLAWVNYRGGRDLDVPERPLARRPHKRPSRHRGNWNARVRLRVL